MSAIGVEAEDILAFWFGSPLQGATPERSKLWFAKSVDTDRLIRSRYLQVHEQAKDGVLGDWLDAARPCLAYIIVTDQFPRNMFRDTAAAFATDALALAAARHALAQRFDRTLQPIERVFLYLPFEHSEDANDQAQAVTLFDSLRANDGMDGFHQYALAHQRIIQRFGRFPHRNAILGRTSSAEELAFLQEPGSRF